MAFQSCYKIFQVIKWLLCCCSDLQHFTKRAHMKRLMPKRMLCRLFSFTNCMNKMLPDSIKITYYYLVGIEQRVRDGIGRQFCRMKLIGGENHIFVLSTHFGSLFIQ